MNLTDYARKCASKFEVKKESYARACDERCPEPCQHYSYTSDGSFIPYSRTNEGALYLSFSFDDLTVKTLEEYHAYTIGK